METALPYVLACVGAFEGHVLMCKYGSREYAGVGSVIGAHFYVLSKDMWIRLYGLHGTYLCVMCALVILRGLVL